MQKSARTAEILTKVRDLFFFIGNKIQIKKMDYTPVSLPTQHIIGSLVWLFPDQTRAHNVIDYKLKDKRLPSGFARLVIWTRATTSSSTMSWVFNSGWFYTANTGKPKDSSTYQTTANYVYSVVDILAFNNLRTILHNLHVL